jgi:hypothetical protein
MQTKDIARLPTHWAVIWYACVMHFIWGTALIANLDAGNTTALSVAVRVFGGHYGAAAAMYGVAALALFGIVRFHASFEKVWCVLPQQFMLVLSAGAATSAMLNSHFADGVVRARAFIVADQIPAILIAIFHVIVVIRMAIVAHGAEEDI